jgi:2-dehydropantoate 2-reductase
MKIAVMGAGALGGYFGGRLAAAGTDVTFIARGAQLDALRSNGLTIESPLGDLHLPRVNATSDPAEVGPVDTVLFLVKLYDTEEAARVIAPLLGAETSIVTFQNGVNSRERIGRIAGEGRVIPGIAVIPADVRAPGIVRHSGPFARLAFGEPDGSESARCKALLAALQKAGVDAEIATNIQVRVWEKFIMLSTLSAITTLTRLNIGPIFADEACATLVERAARETATVGRKVCPALPENAADKALAMLKGMPGHMHASMLDDLNRGKRLELNDLSGEVVRLGRQHDITTPTHEMAWRTLHPYVNGQPPA